MKELKPQLDKEFERQITQVLQITFFFPHELRLIISRSCGELASRVTELLLIIVEE